MHAIANVSLFLGISEADNIREQEVWHVLFMNWIQHQTSSLGYSGLKKKFWAVCVAGLGSHVSKGFNKLRERGIPHTCCVTQLWIMQ